MERSRKSDVLSVFIFNCYRDGYPVRRAAAHSDGSLPHEIQNGVARGMGEQATHGFTAPHAELPKARAEGRRGRVAFKARPLAKRKFR